MHEHVPNFINFILQMNIDIHYVNGHILPPILKCCSRLCDPLTFSHTCTLTRAIQMEVMRFKLTLRPECKGMFILHIFKWNTEISTSPVVLLCSETPKPEACKVIGIATTAYMREALTFTVDVAEAGDGELQIRALGPGGKEKGSLNIGERKDNTYLVKYIPNMPGKHRFEISWAGKAVRGSPYWVTVVDPTKEQPISWLFLVDRLGTSHPADLPEEGQEVEIHATTDYSLLLRVKAQTPKQKKGVLTATSTGEKCGIITIKSTKTSQDTFEALFSPPAADTYTIEAELDDEKVVNTPVRIVCSNPPPDPSKCWIIGLESVPPILQVNEPIPFKVDTRLAGSGKLDIAADGPAAEERPKLHAAASKDEPGIVDVVYTPTAAGTHSVKLNWSGESILGSPLTFDISPIHTHAYGRPVGMDMNIDCKSSKLESYAIHGETGSRYRVKISKVEKGKFNLSFQPQQPGLYGMHVLVKKEEIAGSPFYLRYDSPPKAEAIVVRGLSDTGYIRKPINFVVDTTDAGSGELLIKVKSPATKEEKPELTVEDNKLIYSVGYTPNAAGDHQFDVRWSGNGVPGSPFGVHVLPPVTEEVPAAEDAAVIIPEVVEGADFIPQDILQELEKEESPQEIGMDLGGEVVKERTPEEYTIMLGRATKLKIRPQSEQHQGKLLAAVNGENTGPANPKVSQGKSGNFVVFNPMEADCYTLDMKFRDKPLPRGPFTLNYIEPPSDPSKCRLLGKDNIPQVVVVNEDIYLQVDCREAGNGTLDIKAEAPTLDQYSPKLVATPSKEAPHIADVKYTPTATGVHTLHFQWAKEEIPESPISFSVVDPSMVVVTEPDKIEILSPAHFHVDALYAGPGRLTGTCIGVRSGNVPINVNSEEETSYDVSFIPLVPDEYRLSMNLAGKEIPNSPFLVTLLPPIPIEKVEVEGGLFDLGRQITGLNLENKTFQFGVPCYFKVDCDEVEQGVFEIGCNPPSAASIQMTPIAGTRTYQCRILPIVTGDVEILAQYNGQHIEGSPFHVHFQLFTAGDLALLLAGVETSDATATVESAVTLEQIPSVLTQLIGGQYSIMFDPTKGIEYVLTFKCRLRVKSEKQIQDSPFKLSYVSPFNVDVPTESELGKTVVFNVVPRGRMKGKLKIRTRLCDRGIVASKEDGNYVCKIKPKVAGKYLVNIYWNGVPLSGCPFKLRVVQPLKPQNIQAGPGLEDGSVGQEGSFMIETEDAGTLSVNVEGPTEP